MLSPVRITPSVEQITTATINYNYTTPPDNVNAICPIDREALIPGNSVTRIIHCGHVFRQPNLETWFQYNTRCPLCRFDIRDHATTNVANPSANPSNDVANPSADTSDDVADTSDDVADPSNDVADTSNDVADPSNDVADPSNDVADTSNDVANPSDDVADPSDDVDAFPTQPMSTQTGNTSSNESPLNTMFNSLSDGVNMSESEAETFFANILTSFVPNNLSSALNNINLDISGNTASLSFGVSAAETDHQPNVD
jgi:hypothetical protein